MLKADQIPEVVWRVAMMTYHREIRRNPEKAWQLAVAAAITTWPGLNHDSQAWRGYGGEVLILPLPETKKKTQPGAFDYWPAEEEGNWGDD